MSIRTVSERIKQQNELLVVMAGNEEANSTLMRQSLDEMKEVLMGIQNVLTDRATEESRETLQDKDKEEEKKKGFLGNLFKGNDKKEGKGLLGGIFSKALGLLVSSLPLIGLAGLFFSDVVSGLFAAALGDYDAGALAQRMLSGGLLGSFFGIKGALVGALIGAVLTPEAKEQLGILKDWLVENEVLPKMLSWFSTQLTEALMGLNALTQGDFGGFISGLDNLVLVVGALGLAFAPFKTVGLIISVVKGVGIFLANLLGLPALFGRISASVAAMYATARMGGRLGPGGMGPPLPPGTPTKGGRIGGALKGAGSLISRGARGVGGALLAGAMMAPGAASSVLSSAGGAVRSGASAAGSAISTVASSAGAAASNVGKKAALGAAAKAIPGLGILAGIGFGINSLRNGDPVAAGLHIASGIAGVIPGAGTAASLGLTAAAVSRDMGYLGGGESDIKVDVNGKSESLNEATRERDELVSRTSSNVIMDNSTTNNNVSGGGSIDMSGPISWYDPKDPYAGHV